MAQKEHCSSNNYYNNTAANNDKNNTKVGLKFSLQQEMKSERKSTNIDFTLFLLWQQEKGLGGQRHAPAALTPEKIPDTHFTGG